MNDGQGWRFWIDRGGTFTDVLARSPAGSLYSRKLLSDNPEHYADAALHAISQFLSDESAKFDARNRVIDSIRLGTTLATNAMLERRGAKVALLITRGFADALQIGDQRRPDIFALNIKKSPALYHTAVETDERLAADGTVLQPLNIADARKTLQKLSEQKYEAIAIVLLNAYANSEHEEQLAELARAQGFAQVSTSNQVASLIKFVDRGQTTVAEAYLSPLLQNYLNQFAGTLRKLSGNTQLLCMQSDGGLCSHDRFAGHRAILSGPAAGVVGAAAVCRDAGYERCISFDMGGTSTDVAVYNGSYERSMDNEVAGVRLCVPMMKIHTVAAGGSSMIDYVDGRLTAGPESAGANPGPACYRRGGPLCISDAQLLLGVLCAQNFPKVFGTDASQSLDTESARKACLELSRRMGSESVESTAEAAVAVAVANMVRAIRARTVELGLDPRDYPLCAFGGAAGQHICAVAEELDITTVLLHPCASILSAWGMALAPLRDSIQFTVGAQLNAENLRSVCDRAKQQKTVLVAGLEAQHGPLDDYFEELEVHLKYRGSDCSIAVPLNEDIHICRDKFEKLYRQRFGYSEVADEILIETLSVAVNAQLISPLSDEVTCTNSSLATPTYRQVFVDGGWQSIACWNRVELIPEQKIHGPALIIEAMGTVLVKNNWLAHHRSDGLLTLKRQKQATDHKQGIVKNDPALLEIIHHRLMGIAEQMGVMLEQSARSVNIRERRDFSCAVFDSDGQLVVNAPHIPVHLGSMGAAVQAVIADPSVKFGPQCAYASNDPAEGGTHLPDITVIYPVFDSTVRPIFYLAARGHHADIGGICPASMPANSRSLKEEGIVFHSRPVMIDGGFLDRQLHDFLSSGNWPARNPEQNIADLRAQVAACRMGARELHRVIDDYSSETVRHYSDRLRDSAARAVRRLISRLEDGNWHSRLDNDAEIRVAFSVDHRRQTMQFDFTGSSKTLANNFNAPSAICRAAVLYVIRTLVDEYIPLNDGCLDPVEIIIPEDTLLNPKPGAAIVAGNVETSQVIVDTLLAAMGRLAASQGTMNNLSFGDDHRQYYETICGGAGAGPGFHGQSAVQVHMTNSRMTDTEVLEKLFPVRVEQFGIRTDSGGAGLWHGGNGAIRQLLFLAPLTISLLGNRRRTAAAGMVGAEAGKSGQNWLLRADGSSKRLTGTCEFEVFPGDRVRIETPGGGGWGTIADS